MTIHKKFIMLFCCSGLLLTSCWDSINVEDRGFIIGIGIDLDKEEGNEEDISYEVTHQLVIPAGIGSPSGEGQGNDKAYLNVTTNGKNIYHMNENISTKTSKVPFFEHIKIIIVSEELIRSDHAFSLMLDTFLRDVDMRRGIKLIIAKGNDAKGILEFSTPEEKLPAIHINKLLEQSNQNFGYLETMTIGDIQEANISETSYVLPILKAEDTLIYNSAAAINGPKEKMVGIISPREMQGIEIATRKSVKEVIRFDYKDHDMALEIVRIENDISVNPKDINNIKVEISVNVVGSLKESYGKLNLQKQKTLKSIEDAVSEHMKESIQQAIHKGQNEINTDIFNIWKQLESKHYDTWEKVKDNWEQGENYFSKASFEVDVNTEIFSIGTSNRTN